MWPICRPATIATLNQRIANGIQLSSLHLLLTFLAVVDCSKLFGRLSCVLDQFLRFPNRLASRFERISASSVHPFIALYLLVRQSDRLLSSIPLRHQGMPLHNDTGNQDTKPDGTDAVSQEQPRMLHQALEA